MKFQLSYEIMFGYVQKLQIVHLIPLKTINIVSLVGGGQAKERQQCRKHPQSTSK